MLKRLRKILPLLTLLPTCSCGDCLQQINGYVKDATTGMTLENVTISSESGRGMTITSDMTGAFQYEGISSGFFHCPDVVLRFKKEGYQTEIKKLPAFSSDTVFIWLKPVRI